MFNYGKQFNSKKTAQTEKVHGVKGQKRNNAGGVSFKLDAWDMLDRFLILGSESPTYYAGANKLTKDNAKNIEKLIKKDGVKVVNRIVEISKDGRAPKNDPAIFALAMCAKLGDVDTRKAAYAAVNEVCRIGTHLFHFAEFSEAFGGWGRGMRNAIANWYNSKDADRLQLQVVKYKQRDGWSHRDLLRLAHVKPVDLQHAEIYKYVTSGESDLVFCDESDQALWTIWASEEIKNCIRVDQVVKLITDYNLPREVVPTEWLNRPEVWDALLQKMPMTAMIRNLGKMTSIGVIGPMTEGQRIVVDALNDKEALRKARVHPITLLSALNVYNSGHGFRGSLSWRPSTNVVDALDKAFYASFKNVEPTGKRTLLALDVSGSMDCGEIAATPGLTPRVGSAAMALVTAAVEKNHEFVAFTAGSGGGWNSSAITQLNISPRKRLDTVVNEVSRLPMGRTDCALPMIWAEKNKIKVDTFVIYTDNETWAGSIHPFQALNKYRQNMGIPSKLVVVGMTATNFTIADPSDSGMLDIVGFDSAAPQLISDFSKG